MAKFDWEKEAARQRAASREPWVPRVRDDYVDSAERKQVLAIAAAYAGQNQYCRRIVKYCGDGIGRGVTRKQADTVYKISREQGSKVPRTRTGSPGARDYQLVADVYR